MLWICKQSKLVISDPSTEEEEEEDKKLPSFNSH